MVRGLMIFALLLLLSLPGPALAEEGGDQPMEMIESVVAVVGNRVITRHDLQMAMAPELTQLATDLPKAEQEERFQDIQREALANLIDNELVLVAADRQGVEVTDREIEERVQRMFKGQVLDWDKLAQDVKRIGFESLEHFKSEVSNKILRERIVMMQVRSKVKISDRELDQQFKKHYPDDSYRAVEIAHILFKLSPEAPLDEVRDAFTRGLKLKEKIDKGELTFEEAARKESDDRASGEDRGIIGFVSEGTLEEQFERAVFSLKLGQVSMPVRTALGLHLVKAVSEEMRKFTDDAQREEFKLRLKVLLEEEEFEKAFRRWVEELRASTKIEVRL